MIDFATARARLINNLRYDIKDERVLASMERVPREMFVPLSQQETAYENIPLPIGQGQTISQPLMVALMTEALELKGAEKVLEIGTGSGYQAAILAELARWIITVERHSELLEKARKVLDRLGYTNIEAHLAESILGWQAGAPYDGIIVTSGAPQVPQELVEQLSDGGRLVIPVGSRYEQDLLQVVKYGKKTVTHNLGGCRFVPLVGKGAWSEE